MKRDYKYLLENNTAWSKDDYFAFLRSIDAEEKIILDYRIARMVNRIRYLLSKKRLKLS